MRLRLALSAAVLTLALVAGFAPVAQATHVPTVQDVLDIATVTHGMECIPATAEIACRLDGLESWSEIATIRPGSGNLTSVYTVAAVSAPPLDTFHQVWMRDMHTPACAPSRITAGELWSFVASVGALTGAGTVPPVTITGECSLTGGLTIKINPDETREFDYWINGAVFVPATPTPSPSPTLTATPSATPSATATPSSTSSPTPSATPTSSASSTPTPSESPTSSPTQAGDPTNQPTDGPSAQPSGDKTPEPAVSPTGEGAGEGAGEGGVLDVNGSAAWAASVPLPDEVSTDPTAMAMSALAALLLLVLMGFAGELFNNTLEANYARVIGWWKTSRVGRLGRAFANLWTGGPS